MPLSHRSPKAEVRESPIHGKGLFAREPFTAGEIVAVKGGHVLTGAEWKEIGPELGAAEIQVAEDLFIAPTRVEDRAGAMIFLNHSCEPNVGLQGQVAFVAMRDVEAGEELTHDWATTDDGDHVLACRCGTAACRGTVTGKDWMKPELQERYRGWFCWFLQRMIDALGIGSQAGVARAADAPSEVRTDARTDAPSGAPSEMPSLALRVDIAADHEALLHEASRSAARGASAVSDVAGAVIVEARTAPFPGALVDELHAAAGAILEPIAKERIAWRLENMPDAVVHLARSDGRIVAFKIGHAEDQRRFYSWLGGVEPGHRRRGIGLRLCEAQHAWAKERGHESIETRCHPDNITMLALNLRAGFRVTGLNDRGGRPRLVLSKPL